MHETPAASGPPGLHMTARELQTRTFEGSGASNTTKIPREDTQRDKKSENGAGEEKKARNFRLPPFGAPPFNPPPTFSGFGPSPFKPPLSPCLAPPSGPHHDTHTHIQIDWPRIDWPKLDWPKVVKSGWPKRDWPKSVPSVRARRIPQQSFTRFPEGSVQDHLLCPSLRSCRVGTQSQTVATLAQAIGSRNFKFKLLRVVQFFFLLCIC